MATSPRLERKCEHLKVSCRILWKKMTAAKEIEEVPAAQMRKSRAYLAFWLLTVPHFSSVAAGMQLPPSVS
jgi:hypothetical protein